MSTIARLIRDIYGRHRDDLSGALADYIPELTKANPAWFGI
jgi:glutaminase